MPAAAAKCFISTNPTSEYYSKIYGKLKPRFAMVGLSRYRQTYRQILPICHTPITVLVWLSLTRRIWYTAGGKNSKMVDMYGTLSDKTAPAGWQKLKYGAL